MKVEEIGDVVWINAFEVERHYGGPEEGGWWYDSGDIAASVPMEYTGGSIDEFTEAVHREGDRISALLSKGEWGDIGSVLGGMEVRVFYQDEAARGWPEVTPHYE